MGGASHFAIRIEERVASGKPVEHISSVASFFISRVDVNIDGQLEKIGDKASHLQGKVAIANALLIPTDLVIALHARE